MCVRARARVAHVNVHEGERFTNMSLECLLYPIQYLFLAPHISVPIDSSDSRQDNNRTALPSLLLSTIITALPKEHNAGMVGWKQRNKGKEDKGKEEMATVCYFLFQDPCTGALRWREKMSGRGRKKKGWRTLGDGNK